MDKPEKKCLFWFLVAAVCLRFAAAEDVFGVWYKTLRPLQSHSCDRQELKLACSSTTIISVHYVWYGRQRNSGHLCPSLPPAAAHVTPCNSNTALQVIQEKCHGKRMCRLYTSPDTFRDDPCPGVGKFAEVIYKCRPETFRNKIVCENEWLSLNCPAGQGLTIFSATFGTMSVDPGHCQQPENYTPGECLISMADETVRSLCSGKQNCTFRADDRTFGNPNCRGTKHLRVTFNCVDSNLLLLPSGRPAVEGVFHTTSFPAWAHGGVSPLPLGRPSLSPTQSSNLRKQEMQSDEVPLSGSIKPGHSKDTEVVGFMSKVMTAQKFVSGNTDRLILYVAISMSVGLVVFVTILGSRVVIRRLGRPSQDTDIEMTAQNEDQFFSDSDLDHYDSEIHEVPMVLPPPVVQYSASMRRKSSDMVPRTPVADTGVDVDSYFS